MISQPSLDKFKKIYKKIFDEDLSEADASRKATALRNLYLAVYGSPLENKNSQQADNLN